MAVASINGQEINGSNAYEFYYDICHDKYKEQGIDKDSPEGKRCKQFLSQDQIDYCQTTDKQTKDKGAEKIDAKDANSQKEENGDDAMFGGLAAAGGSVYPIVAQTKAILSDGLKAISITAFASLGFGAVAAALGIYALKSVENLDPNKEGRLASEAKSEDDISTIKATTQIMQENQESMEADAAEYDANQQALLDARSQNENTLSELSIEMYDAQACGNRDKAAELEQAIAELEGMEFDDGGMSDLKMRVHDYENAGLEADGLNESATSVSAFLNEGNKLNAAFVFAGIGYAFGALGSAICAVAGFASAAGKWWEIAAAVAGGVLFTSAAIMFGISAGKAFSGAGEEAKCATAGEKYAEPMENMISERGKLSEKINETNAGYEASDAAAAETMVEVKESAEGATNENNGTTSGGTPVATGGGSGGGSGSGGATV